MRAGSFLLLALGLTATRATAQTRDPSGQDLPSYRFEASVPVDECTFAGDLGAVSLVTVPTGSQFVLVGETTVPAGAAGGVLAGRPIVMIQFLPWPEGTDKWKTLNVNLSDPLKAIRTFCADRAAFDRFATRTYDAGWSSWDLAAGVLLLPIKMRLGGDGRPFDFSRDVTLGTVVGPRVRVGRTRDVHVAWLVGAGVTAITLTPENTNSKVTAATDRAAVTLTVGMMLEAERFQIGLMYGADRISNPNQSDWRYQGKPWLSLGLGYTLLSSAPQTPATGQR